MRFGSFISLAVLIVALNVRTADAGDAHEHREVVVNSKPVISQLPIRLQQPRRVMLRKNGSVVIADWGAGKVVQINGRKTIVLADKLNQPAGLTEDADGNILVANYAGGKPDEGNIIRLTPGGKSKPWKKELVIDGLTGPTDLVTDKLGEITIAEYTADRLSRISADGNFQPAFSKLVRPSSLVIDRDGRIFATSSKQGTLVSVPSSGDPIVICGGLESPSDLALDEKNNLIAVSYLANSIVRIIPEKESFKRIASVPEGTIGIAYQKDGNFVVVNWETQSATRITSRLFIDCPHCTGRIPVRLVPKLRKSLDISG